jgi:cytochrome P450
MDHSLAGSETTSSALSGLTAHLLRSPKHYTKLTTEIRSTFSTPESITHDRLQKLPYLNACINEGLRIFPPISPGLLRKTPPEGAVIDSYHVPGGTTVSVSSWAAGHSASNFAEADEFVPERWIEEGWEGDQKKAAQAFSLGPRACLGKK